MSDDDLKLVSDGLKRAPPSPDESAREENFALAMKNFDRLQESRDGTRPTPEATRSGWLRKGVTKMFQTLSTRGAIAASTALVAVAVAVTVLPTYQVGTDLRLREVATQKTDDTRMEEEQFVDVEPLVEPAPMELAPMELAEADMAASAPEALAAAPPTPTARVAAPGVGGLAIFDDAIRPAPTDTETYANAAPNPLKITSKDPVSTFSADVDTASWSLIRNMISRGQLPPSDAVRIEEMVNYFPYAYPAPEGPHPFQPTVSVMGTPWNAGTQLVHIGIQGEMPEVDARPPLNLVFLIDTSGSMDDPTKLPLLKQSFALMLSELRPEDEVSIVTYAGSAGQVLEPTRAADRATILAALDRLHAGGATAGQAGLQQAYAVAESMTMDGEVSRVILATDGDFNVGLSDPEALKNYIADKRKTGTYLSVLGFGRGNLQDATMQALAQNGNGQAAYIDTLSEAQKVLVDQLTGALFPIADDVKIQVEFNPAMVAEYRLIGYETRALAREDFNNDAVDAGEIGAGHTVTAIYEVTPVGSEAVMTDALRYAPPVEADGSGELGFLKLRYKAPGEEISTLIETPILPEMGTAGDDARFSVAVAGFGQLLRGGKYLGNWGYSDLIALANANKGADEFGYRAEAVKLMRLAETLSR
ncbi:VWA domain-containing protein [Aliiroseovarius sp.]|uniref:vWA domain-containing protein n=1 Tax=Aliiroseovarius sp. TaxID=1872442 RepID=UPI0026110498|nr:VWA domain-containing protein [Aliiroseovarius sp.]